MKPVFQTQFGDRGNCMSAALASLLEIPLESVPNFYDAGQTDAHWHHALMAWLESRGFGIVQIGVSRSDSCVLGYKGYGIASGPSPRNPNHWHATVWHNGKIVHDPAGECAEPLEPLGKIEVLEFLYPLDPALMVKK